MRAEADLGERIVGTSSHLEEVRRMIIAGLGIGPLPLHVAQRDVERGQLWQLPPYDKMPEIDVHVVWNPRAKLNRAEEAMLAGLIDLIARTPMEQRIYD
jgi:DNA-binding transcriptional LysR family regulator